MGDTGTDPGEGVPPVADLFRRNRNLGYPIGYYHYPHCDRDEYWDWTERKCVKRKKGETVLTPDRIMHEGHVYIKQAAKMKPLHPEEVESLDRHSAYQFIAREPVVRGIARNVGRRYTDDKTALIVKHQKKIRAELNRTLKKHPNYKQLKKWFDSVAYAMAEELDTP